MAACHRCGHSNPDNAKYCLNCGAALHASREPAPAKTELARPPGVLSAQPQPHQVPSAQPRPPVAPSASPSAASLDSPVAASPASAAKPSSLLDSLRGLGLRPTCGQIAGFVGAVVFGLVLARALPFVFPVFYPALNFVFREVLGREPDAFNTAAMTWLTCLGSAGVAFASTFLLGRMRKKGGG